MGPSPAAPPRAPSPSPYLKCPLIGILAAATTVTLVLGIVGSLLLRADTFGSNNRIVSAEFGVTSATVSDIIEASMVNAGQVLTLMSAAMAVFPAMSFGEFVAVVSSVRESAHQQAVEWIPRVAGDDRAAWEGRVSAYLGSNMTFTELTPTGSVVVRATAPEYYPVAYVDPVVGNERVILFDDASSPERFAPLQQAINTGKPVMSPPISLVQAHDLPGSPLGALVFTPV